MASYDDLSPEELKRALQERDAQYLKDQARQLTSRELPALAVRVADDSFKSEVAASSCGASSLEISELAIDFSAAA